MLSFSSRFLLPVKPSVRNLRFTTLLRTEMPPVPRDNPALIARLLVHITGAVMIGAPAAVACDFNPFRFHNGTFLTFA
jgi:hypothetical protein